MTLCRREGGCGAIAFGGGGSAGAASGWCWKSSRGSHAFHPLDIGAPFPEKDTFPSSRRRRQIHRSQARAELTGN